MSPSVPVISIIMPCFNAGEYLRDAIQSVIDQVFTEWELVIINDGSTDKSEGIAREFERKDARIKVYSKENGGYVSARLHGLRYISNASTSLLFFDADDCLHPEMLKRLQSILESNPELGAVYCNHILMDSQGKITGEPTYGVRLVPTLFGVKQINDQEFYTSFVSIFCWATRMIEPMTLIRRIAYEDTSGWDIRFGKGRGNIGEGVLLFSEMALKWKAAYLHEGLYYYRKHPNQATADPVINKKAGDKVVKIWEEKISAGHDNSRDIRAAIIAYKYRIEAFRKMGSLKYYLKFKPHKAIALGGEIIFRYLMSLQLLFYRDTKVFRNN